MARRFLLYLPLLSEASSIKRMRDIIDPRHEAYVEHLFRRVCIVLNMPGFELRPLRRRARGVGKLHSYRLGYTKLGEKKITIDLYTPHTSKPRQIDAILRVVCHELAHHQSPPKVYRRGRHVIHHDHHPEFWQQSKKDVEALKKDELLGSLFKEEAN